MELTPALAKSWVQWCFNVARSGMLWEQGPNGWYSVHCDDPKKIVEEKTGLPFFKVIEIARSHP